MIDQIVDIQLVAVFGNELLVGGDHMLARSDGREQKGFGRFFVLMCDQFRFDCIAAQGNPYVATPNLDRLVRRGISFDNAYSTCPVCAPARLTLRTGREPYTTLCYDNGAPRPMPGMSEDLHERCGDYLAREMTRRGYRTFGIGKFHSTQGTLEDMGYDEQMNTEEMWSNPEERARDAYAGFMMREHPEYMDPSDDGRPIPVPDDEYRAEETRVLKSYGNVQYGETITRDILIPGDMPLYAIHYMILAAFGFQNSHLHRFELPHRQFLNVRM